MLKELSLETYLARTASVDPLLPGGGSAAALSGALAAALIEMVANLTLGRRKFAGVDAEMRAAAGAAAKLRSQLTAGIDLDSEAYAGVIEAFQLPRGTAAEKAVRQAAMEAALRQAALVPLGVARNALAVMTLGGAVLRKGNPNAASDGATGVLAARMAVRAAVCSVRINLGSIEDAAFKSDLGREADRMEAEAERLEKSILAGLDL